MNALLESTAGVIFMGTPHTGSNLADWASILTKFSGIVRPTNKPIVSVLQPGSEMLANLQQEFHTMLDARQSQGRRVPRIYCFFEELAYNSVIGHIVPRHSAILSRYSNQGIHANHVDMTRFASPMDQGYQSVCSQLKIWILEVEEAGAGQAQQSLEGRKLVNARDLAGSSHVYSGCVNTHGGQVIQGNLSSSGDINLSHGNGRLPR